MSTFDVWIIRFEPGERPPAERLRDVFGIDIANARALEQSVPKVVRHAVPAKAAGELRQALESIGAVVECRPARNLKPVVADRGTESATIFHPPSVDLFPSDRISAIDAFAPSASARAPRISVDDVVAPIPVPRTEPASENEPSREIRTSLLATSPEQQRRRFIRRAVGMIVVGATILAIDWFLGRSVFRGEANWVGIGLDALGIYFLGLGVYELVIIVRT